MSIRPSTCGVITFSLMTALSACTIRDDSVRENQLDSLRVLGIASSPADLILGQTAALSTLVYSPENQPIDYRWSWCPSRGGEDTAFACLIDESELQAAWATLNTGTTLPPYDLGNAETASFELAFEAEQALALCQLLTSDAPDPQLALFTCLSGLGLSIQLRVSTPTEEVIALKSIPLRGADTPPNLNPQLEPTLSIRLGSSRLNPGLELAAGEPLRATVSYVVEADIAPDASQVFTPEAQEGQDPPEARQETLFLSWFVTTGSTHRKGEVRTSLFERGPRENFLRNVWDMDFDIDTDLAQLFLVLRDERGGISWSQHAFDLVEAQ